MRRKVVLKAEAELEETSAPAVVPPTIYSATERAFTIVPCIVCGADTRSDLSERLCWVCRRLKISAWRDSEPMPAQE